MGAAALGASIMKSAGGPKKDPKAIYGYSTEGGKGMSQVTGYIPSAAEINRTSYGLAPGSNAAYKYGLEGKFTLVDGDGKYTTRSAQEMVTEQNQRLVDGGSPKKMGGGSGYYQAIMGNYVPTPGYVAPTDTAATTPPASPAATPAATPTQGKLPTAPAMQGKAPAAGDIRVRMVPANTGDPKLDAMTDGSVTEEYDGKQWVKTTRKPARTGSNTLIGGGLLGTMNAGSKTLFGQ